MKEERGTEDIWLCLIGVAAILGACGMTFDILFDILLSVGSAGVAVGLGGSAESPQLTLLVYGALFFKPLFGVAMFVGGLFSILCSGMAKREIPLYYDFNLRGGGRRRRGGIFADGGLRRAVCFASVGICHSRPGNRRRRPSPSRRRTRAEEGDRPAK